MKILGYRQASPCKSKVSNLEAASFKALTHHQYIGRLQVSVEGPILMHEANALEQLPDKRPSADPS